MGSNNGPLNGGPQGPYQSPVHKANLYGFATSLMGVMTCYDLSYPFIRTFMRITTACITMLGPTLLVKGKNFFIK